MCDRRWLTTLLLLTLAAKAISGPLEDLIIENIQQFNDTDTLHHQLNLLLRLSLDLLKSKLGEDSHLVHHLQQANNRSSIPKDVLTGSFRTLALLRTDAESETTTTVLARRTLFAYLALHLLNSGQGSRLDEDAEQHLSQIASQFYTQHVDCSARKGLIDYLHISKSGGTSFSLAAKKSKCIKTRGIGQPLYLGDLPHWINRTVFYELTNGVHMTWSIYGRVNRTGEVHGCEQRAARIQHAKLQYVSNEYTVFGGEGGMQGAHLCPQGVNVVTLRDPDLRLVSHMHFLLAHMRNRLVGADAEEPDSGREELFRRAFCSSNVSVWEAVAPAVMDNYVVRSFLGESGFHSPVGGIGEEAVAVARRLLLQFDLVLDLGAGDEAANLLMRQGLGWNVTLAEVHTRSSEGVYARLKYDKEECRNGALLAAVAHRQHPDRVLYRFGRVLSFLDRLLLVLSQHLGLQPKPSVEALGFKPVSNRCGIVGWAPEAAPSAHDAKAGNAQPGPASSAAAAEANWEAEGNGMGGGEDAEEDEPEEEGEEARSSAEQGRGRGVAI